MKKATASLYKEPPKALTAVSTIPRKKPPNTAPGIMPIPPITADTKAFADYFKYMLDHGVHLASSQFEAMFLSCMHTDDIVEDTLAVFEGYLKQRKA